MIALKDVEIAYHAGQRFTVPLADFPRGKLTVLIGRNGSGKSTVLRAIAGQLPYRGSIRLGEKECSSYTQRERARSLAYLPQLLNSANMDVKTLVEHGRYPYHGNLRGMTAHDRELVERALELTSLTALREKSLHTLSGGERQRAYLAMVIAQDTPMILLDEPATYMDVSHQLAFLEILRSLTREGRGIVMASHDLPQSFHYGDRICLMDGGSLQEPMSPEELLQRDGAVDTALGVTLKRIADPELLYAYALGRGSEASGGDALPKRERPIGDAAQPARNA